MQSSTMRSAYCYLCGVEAHVTRQQISLNGKLEQHMICQECAAMAQGHTLRHVLKDERLSIEYTPIEHNKSEVDQEFEAFRRAARMDAYHSE